MNEPNTCPKCNADKGFLANQWQCGSSTRTDVHEGTTMTFTAFHEGEACKRRQANQKLVARVEELEADLGLYTHPDDPNPRTWIEEAHRLFRENEILRARIKELETQNGT